MINLRPMRTAQQRAADHKRLSEALDKVVAALDAQKESVADFRDTLDDLHDRVGQLGRSMHRYRSKLGAIHIDRACRETNRLVAILDGKDKATSRHAREAA